MSKTIMPYGTDAFLKKKITKDIIELFYDDTNYFNTITNFQKNIRKPKILSVDLTENSRFFLDNFGKEIMRILPANYEYSSNNISEKFNSFLKIIKNNFVLELYNYGKYPKNINALTNKSIKRLFENRDFQKTIISMLNDEDVSVKELTDKIYSLLKEEGYNPNEISMKIKDINQVLRIKRMKEVISLKEDEREKVKNIRNFLEKEAKELIKILDLNNNYKNKQKLKKIIKLFSTYSLNMPLIRKLKKEFPNTYYEDLKKAEKRIKNIVNKYNIEESLLFEKMRKFFEKGIIREFQKQENNSIENLIDEHFQKIPLEDTLMDKEHKTIVKTLDFYKNSFISLNSDSVFGTNKNNRTHLFQSLKDTSTLFMFILSKDKEEKLKEFKDMFEKMDKSSYSEDFINSIKNSLSSVDKFEKFLLDFIIDDMNLKDTISFPIYYEIFKKLIDEVDLINEKVCIPEYIQKFIRKSMVMSSLDNEDKIAKDVIKYLYNYYYGFLFKEEKFWEKIPYFVNSEFLRAIRELAFKNNIKIDNELVKEFKKKYALKILSKIENIDKKDIKPFMQKFINDDSFNYNIYHPAPYNITLSGEKINREFVRNLEEFFYLNAETLNIPSYDSLVSLSREHGKDKVNEYLDKSINKLKENLSNRDFKGDFFNLLKKPESIFYKKTFPKKTLDLRRFAIFNFEKIKDFLNNAIKEIKIDLPEYKDSNIENLIKKIQNAIKEDNVEFADWEIDILKKAQELAKEESDTQLEDFVKRVGWKNNEDLFNFIINFKRRLESLLSLYPERENSDLEQLSNMMEKFIRNEIDEEILSKFLSDTFLIDGNSLRDKFINLSKTLKDSIDTLEIRVAFLIEDAINDIAIDNQQENNIKSILEKIKDENVKKAILEFDSSYVKDKETKQKIEDFLYRGKIDALKDILNIQEKELEKVKFKIAGITDRNPLVKTFKAVIKAAKNLFYNDIKIEEPENIKDLIVKEEIDFHKGNIIFKVDRDYIFNKIKNRRFMDNNKINFISSINEIARKFKSDTIEISTDEIENYLNKIFIKNEGLNTQESIKLFIYTKIIYPKIATLQGTHDILRSHGAFTFFTIKDPNLREIINTYTSDSLISLFRNKNEAILFKDFEITNQNTKEAFLDYANFYMFNSILIDGLSNNFRPINLNSFKKQINILTHRKKLPMDGILTLNTNSFTLAFNPNKKLEQNLDNLLEKRGLQCYCENILDDETYRKIFNGKNLEEMTKEEIRNYLLNSLTKRSNNLTCRNQFTESLEELLEFAKEFESSINKVKKELSNKNITKEEISKYLKMFNLKLEDFYNSGEFSTDINQLLRKLNNIVNNFMENYQNNDFNLANGLENLILNIESIEKIILEIKEDIKNKLDNSLINKYNKNIEEIVKTLNVSLEKAIELSHNIDYVAINQYVDRIAKEGWDYKDLFFLRENLSFFSDILKDEIFINYYAKSAYTENNYDIELDKRNLLINKIFNRNDIDKSLKDALIIYQIDHFYKEYINYATNYKEKLLLTADKKSVKKDKNKDLYLNIAQLNSFDTRVGELLLMPEIHFNKRSYLAKESAKIRHFKANYYYNMYNFNGEYAKNKSYINVDKLRNKIFDIYGLHKFINSQEELDTNKNSIDELSIEKVSKEKIKITIKQDNKDYHVIIPIKLDKNIRDMSRGYLSTLEYAEPKTYYSLLLLGTKILSKDKQYPDILYDLAESVIKEDKKITLRDIKLYIEDYDKKSKIKHFINTFSKMSVYIKNLSDEIKKDPSVYLSIIDTIKNKFDESILLEKLKIKQIKETIKEKVKEIEYKEEFTHKNLFDSMKKEIREIVNNFIQETNKKAAKVFINYGLLKNSTKIDANKIETLVDGLLTRKISKEDKYNVFSSTIKDKKIYLALKDVLEVEKQIVNEISDNLLKKEQELINGKLSGFINYKEKDLSTRTEVMTGIKNDLLNNYISNYSNAVIDFEKNTKRIVFMQYGNDFNLSTHFEKVKKEFENTFNFKNKVITNNKEFK